MRARQIGNDNEIRMGQGAEKEKAAALAANQAKFDQGLKGILTPAQFETYKKEKNSKRKLK